MKALSIFAILVLMASCATKVPYTKKIKEEFDLNEDKLKKVQFYSSRMIILERKEQAETTATTGQSGDLVVSSSSLSERIVIPANTKCIFDKFGENGAVLIRFEVGAGRTITFAERTGAAAGSGRFYLQADWKGGRGELDYGGAVYFAVSGSESAYLMVKLKQWQRNKRKDRVVRGMKVS
jgi:hypothetical protein